VLDAGGEIYRYVGNEIIVTWPLAKGARDAAAIACLFAIEDALSRGRAEYRRSFGAEPRLRCALHAGPLIVGEMGDIKREIVMLGDTMNTAARIEEACRTTGRDVIASSSLLHAMRSLPPADAGAVCHARLARFGAVGSNWDFRRAISRSSAVTVRW
jgi:adenylate cyclase